MAKGKETPTGRKEQQGRGGGDRGSKRERWVLFENTAIMIMKVGGALTVTATLVRVM